MTAIKLQISCSPIFLNYFLDILDKYRFVINFRSHKKKPKLNDVQKFKRSRKFEIKIYRCHPPSFHLHCHISNIQKHSPLSNRQCPDHASCLSFLAPVP